MALAVALVGMACGATDTLVLPPAPASKVADRAHARSLAPRESRVLRGAVPSAETQTRFELDTPAEGFFPRADELPNGVDPDAVDALIRDAAITDSDALIVLVDGRVIVERTFGRSTEPIELMSATKTIVAMAVAFALEDGAIHSLDEPVGAWLPEWRRGRRGRVTVRHLLTHRSGIAHESNTKTLTSKRDRAAFVRGLDVESEPGMVFSYNNEAVQLLGVVIEQAMRRSVERVIAERVFEPMGISNYAWAQDRAGHAATFYGLSLAPRDVARIAQLWLDDGRVGNRRILPAGWVQRMTTPAEPAIDYHGLLAWLRRSPDEHRFTAERLDALRGAGVGDAAKLRGLVGRSFDEPAAFFVEAGARLGERDRRELARLEHAGFGVLDGKKGSQIGFYADGWLGQTIAVYPAGRLVGVRLHRARHGGDQRENERYGFRSFLGRLERIVDAPALTQ